MALVINRADYALDLTSGRLIAPGEMVNADITGAHEVELIDRGLLQVLDPSLAPPVLPTVAHATVYVGEAAPVTDETFLWVQTDSTGAFLDLLFEAAS